MRTNYIHVVDQYEGFHWYADAPEQVAFLRNRHRHIFKVDIWIQVKHDNRELEFFMVKDQVKHLIMAFTGLLDNLGSCEQQANRILDGLVNQYGSDRIISVEVSEDGENSASVEHQPDIYYNPNYITTTTPTWSVT